MLLSVCLGISWFGFTILVAGCLNSINSPRTMPSLLNTFLLVMYCNLRLCSASARRKYSLTHHGIFVFPER